jgi:hypothetical protein
LNISGLAQNTNYMFRVLTVCSGSENSSLYSQPRQFKTCSSADACVHCLTPDNLDAKDVTVSSAKLTWDPGQGAGAYEVQYRKASETNWLSAGPSQDDKLTLGYLHSGTHYVYRVRSVCSEETRSDYSAEASFRTLDCVVPERFRATNIDYRSAKMKWEEVPGARFYLLRYKQTSSSTWNGPYAPDKTSYDLFNLTPKTEYEVQISTFCSGAVPADESEFSESVRFTTACQVPEGISVTTTSNSAAIDWASTDAGVYALRYRKTTSTQPWTEILDLTKSNYTISGLTGGDYEFQVRSKCSSTDLSEWSVKSRFSLPCSNLTSLRAEPSRDSVTLTWNGAGEIFEVRYKSNSTDWKIVRASRSPFTVRNLQEGTTYDFQARAICALNSNGEDVLHSNWVGVTATTTGGGSCSNPMVLHCRDNIYIIIQRKGSNKLIIRWGSFNRLTGWRLEIRPVNGGSTSIYDNWDYDEFKDCRPGEEPDHIDYYKTVRGLRPDTTYDFEVSIKCSDGKYSPIRSRRYTTSNSSSVAPTALPPTGVGATSATLQWQPVAGATGYRVSYSLADSDDETGTLVNVGASTTSLQLFGLTTGATYVYEVQALFQNSTSDLSETITFVPSPACSYGVSPPNHAAIAAEGGSGSVSVTAGAGCSWTCASNASWISITSGGGGTGSGTVSYSVSANPASDPRNGSLTIAGQTVQINQLGANPDNLTPVITEISPSKVVAGRGAFTLEVKGQDFLPDSYVVVDGFVQETTFVSSSLLTVNVWEHAVASPGAKNVVAHNPLPGAKISNTVSLTVEPSTANLPPWVSAISPRRAITGGSEFTLTVYGASFVNGSVVRFNGGDRPTTFVSSGLLTTEILSEDVEIVGSPSITVFTPEPGGGLSNPATFYVQEDPNHPVPVITAISPVNVIAGGASFTLVIDGSGFIGPSRVRINEIWRTTIYVTPTRLTASIRSSDIESSGVLAITVYNTEPGGGVSNEVALNVSALLSTSPNTTDLIGRAEKLPDRGDYHAGLFRTAHLGISETERDAESQNPPSQPDRRKNRIAETITSDALVLWVITAFLMFIRVRKLSPRAR